MKRNANILMRTGQRQSSLLGVIFIVLIPGIFQSCSKNNYDFSKMTTPEWNPTWSLPLIHSDLTLHDILKKDTNAIFVEDSGGMITLEYAANLFSQTAEQYMIIPDQRDITMETSTLQIIVPPTDSVPYDITVPYSFTPAQTGQRLDSIFIKSASIKIDISSYINHSSKVTVSIPNAIKNGKIFQTTVVLDYTIPLPVKKTINLDFSGYKMLFNNSPGHINEITANSHIIVYGDQNPDLSPYTFVANCDLLNIKFSKIFGYLGQYEYPLSDTLSLKLFTNTVQGNIDLKEIDLFLNTVNSIGMPIQINFLDLIAHSPVNPPYTVNIADPATGFPNPVTIPSPDLQHIGTVADTTFQFGDNNSNIIPAINMAPEYIYFNVNGKANPANNPAYENFVFDTSRFAVNFKVVLPLFGSIGGFHIADTVAFDFNIPDQAEMLAFKVRTENHFPLDAEMQINFADKDYKILDSLFSGNNHYIIVAAPVGGPPEYRVIETPPIQPYTFSPDPFMADDLKKLEQAKFLLINAKMSTYNSDLVKIYADYKLDVKLAAKLQIKTQN